MHVNYYNMHSNRFVTLLLSHLYRNFVNLMKFIHIEFKKIPNKIENFGVKV